MAKAANLDSVIKTAEPKKETVKATTSTPVIEKKQTKKYDAHELIQVRSIVHGTLLLPGKKSGILYRWGAYGDISEVEYQDLYVLKASRSGYLFKPFFVIEDEELLSDPTWSEVAKLYDSMFDVSDINAVISLPVADFEATLAKLPEGYKNAIKMEVATRLENGTFDSIKKIQIVDKICGTDLFNTMK